MKTKKFLDLINSINNKKKLRIINHILLNGEKSITDVHNELSMSFSTTHKYLDEMDKACVLSSRIEKKGRRVKKLYSVKNFRIKLTPDLISELVSGKKKEKKKEKINKFVVIDWEGSLIKISIESIKKKCIEKGIPLNIIEKICETLEKKIYDGMTIYELKKNIFSIIKSKKKNLDDLEHKMNEMEIFFKKRNLLTMLGDNGYENIVNHHIKGDFHIRNMISARPINFLHDPSLITKYGLKAIGMRESPGDSMDTIIQQLIMTVEACNKEIIGKQQGFESLNVFLAPFTGKNFHSLNHNIKKLMYSLSQLFRINGVQTTINLETSIPAHLKKEKVYVEGEEKGVYEDYEDEAKELLELFIKFISEKDMKYPAPFIKIRKKSDIPDVKKILDKAYFVNHIPKWQKSNSNYMLDWTRISSDYKGWKRSYRTGCLQMITLNTPRFAEQGFNKILEKIKKCLTISAEDVIAKQYTEMNYVSQKINDETYSHISSGLLSVGLTGIKEYIELSGKEYNTSSVKKVLNNINKKLSNMRLRCAITEVDFPPLTNRFKSLDKIFRKNNKHSPGISTPVNDMEKIKFLSKIHPLMKGGHNCCLNKITMDKFEKILKTNIGMFCDKKRWIKGNL